MKETIEKLKSVIKALEKRGGPLLICALVLREDSLERWDVIISASWLSPKEMESYKIVSSELQNSLSSSELMQYSRIVLLNPEDPVVSFLLDLETIKNGGYKELPAETLSDEFGFAIKRAYLLRSQKIPNPS